MDVPDSEPVGHVAIWMTALLGERGSRRKKVTTGLLATIIAAIVGIGVKTYWHDALVLVAEVLGKELHYASGRIQEDAGGLHLQIQSGASGMAESGKNLLALQFIAMLRETGQLESVSTKRPTTVGLLYKKTRQMPQGLVVFATYGRTRIVRFDPSDEHADSFYIPTGASVLRGRSRVPTSHLREFHLQTARLLGEYERLNHLALYIDNG